MVTLFCKCLVSYQSRGHLDALLNAELSLPLGNMEKDHTSKPLSPVKNGKRKVGDQLAEVQSSIVGGLDGDVVLTC